MSHGALPAAEVLLGELRAFEPGLWSGADCAALAVRLAAVEKACAAARVRAAARAAACGALPGAGAGDPAEWLARQTGTSGPRAREELETAEALAALPRTREAVEAGELSLEQAREIARTEADAPGSEAELLGVARTQSLRALKDRARKRRMDVLNIAELHRRRRGARYVRHWRNELGNVCGRFELPPEVGVPFVNRLDAETGRIRRAARRDHRTSAPATSGSSSATAAVRGAGDGTGGEVRAGLVGAADAGLEPWEAYAADALVRMFEGGGRGKHDRADLIVVCDLNAWRRGHTHPGEVCHVIGGGPIPVEVAKELGKDAFLKAVLHDGVAIHTVAHLGRHRPAELRTALDLGPPPDLDGVTCRQDGCDRRYGLEWDHIDPVANDGPTSYQNLQPLCWQHHQHKTHTDRNRGLLTGRHAE